MLLGSICENMRKLSFNEQEISDREQQQFNKSAEVLRLYQNAGLYSQSLRIIVNQKPGENNAMATCKKPFQ